MEKKFFGLFHIIPLHSEYRYLILSLFTNHVNCDYTVQQKMFFSSIRMIIISYRFSGIEFRLFINYKSVLKNLLLKL